MPKLVSEDENVKTFTKMNLTKASTPAQMKFQLQELAGILMTKFEQAKFSDDESAEFLAFFFKEFQRKNRFLAVDFIQMRLTKNKVHLI